jgi:hypothetical protein
MPYVCLIFDCNARVLRVETLAAGSDEAARDHAVAMQLTTRAAAAFEVWDGGRQVASFRGGKPAWRSRRMRVAAE